MDTGKNESSMPGRPFPVGGANAFEYFMTRTLSIPRPYVMSTLLSVLVLTGIISFGIVHNANSTSLSSPAAPETQFVNGKSMGSYAEDGSQGETDAFTTMEAPAFQGESMESQSFKQSARRRSGGVARSSELNMASTSGGAGPGPRRDSTQNPREAGGTPSSMFIYQGSATVDVRRDADMEQVMDEVQRYVEGNKGYIENRNLDKPRRNNLEFGSASAHMTVRIPSDKFYTLFDWLSRNCVGVESLGAQSMNTQDVTQEYVDTETRLRVKRNAMERFEQIMSKATTVQETLNVQREMNRLTEEIESQKRRQQWLEKQVSLSTVTLYFRMAPKADEPPRDDGGWHPWSTIRYSFNLWVQGAQWFIDFLIVFVVVLLPVSLIVGLVAYFTLRLIHPPTAQD
eukprot:gb/GECG01004068.1/.p1 GENE.gb/GECG01004068.1/~~gb/GECG01004068.1/.p1  ORF type:complete len:399 (+),score=53.18 gb/GECG01004068.1/:1-1197(+)